MEKFIARNVNDVVKGGINFKNPRWQLSAILVCTNLFQVDCETSSTTYINHSRRFIPDGIRRHEGMRKEKPVLPFLMQGDTGTTFYVFGMMRPRFDPATSRTRSGYSTTSLCQPY